MSVVLLTRATFCTVSFGVTCVLSLGCSFRLSVPVQVIDWKDSSLKRDSLTPKHHTFFLEDCTQFLEDAWVYNQKDTQPVRS